MADAIFEDPRLASVYDPLDPDRSDLDVYVALAEELGARSVLDIGCGTGTFACMLAQRGLDVTAVDPARASLDRRQVEASLAREGFQLAEVRDAPDRPGREFVFLARRPE